MNNKNDMTKLIGKLIRNVNALESVHVTKKSTSHYNFGTEEPFIKDRFDIQIELGSNKVIDCQVIFDSTDYSFPPDILFRKPSSLLDVFEINNLSELLPKNWSITNEYCLRDWFARLLSLVKRSSHRKWPAFSDDPSSEKQSTMDEDYDDFMFENVDKGKRREDDEAINQQKDKEKHKNDEIRMLEEAIIWNDIEEKKSQKRKWGGLFERGEKRKKETVDEDIIDYNTRRYNDKVAKLNNHLKEQDSGSDFESPVKIKKLTHDTTGEFSNNAPAVRKTKAEHSDSTNQELRKKFMTAWLKKYQHHILQYDAENFKSFSLYLTFYIPEQSSTWHKFNQLKQNKLVEFNAYNEINVKLCKPKPYAPMICHFNMDPYFPTTKLKIKLISVINTTDVGSTEPDFLDIDYEVDITKSTSSLIENICKYLADQVIPFHLQLE